MSQKKVLVVDDEPDIRTLVKEILEDEDYQVETAKDAASARLACQKQQPDLVLLDIWMPDEDGITLLQEWKKAGTYFPVIMMSGHGTVETAVEATRLGAIDFIEKPLSLARLLATVEKVLSADAQTVSANEGQPASSHGILSPEDAQLIGSSDYIKSIRKHIEQLASHEVSVLILGEPGTGKGLMARNIHLKSARAKQPFIEVQAGTLNAANGLTRLAGEVSHPLLGLLEEASGGTLFIKNITQLPMSCQLKLLASIESQQVAKVDNHSTYPLNVRFIISSDVSLTSAIAQGTFKKELYYKLNTIPLQTSPLREHTEDIPALLEYFANFFVEKQHMTYRHFNVSAQNRLRNHEWPGNVRELKNLVQRLLITGEELDINAQAVSDALVAEDYTYTGTHNKASMPIPLDLPLREARAQFERTYLLQQLEESDGSIVELAKRVGMERTHLYRKLRSLGIDQGRSKN